MKNNYFFFKHSLLAILTLSRIPFSILISRDILFGKSLSKLTLFLYLITLFTDFIDGKLARSLKLESKHGAILDVSTDVFFIFSTSLSLCYKGLFPLWFIFIILIKLVEFLITSRILAKKKNNNKVFIFDILGRMVSVSYYILPLFILLVNFYFTNILFKKYIHLLFSLITFFSMISLFYRIHLVLKKEEKNKQNGCHP